MLLPLIIVFDVFLNHGEPNEISIRTLAVAVATALLVPIHATIAQDENLTEEVVVIGTRTEGRSALDSPAPVDVIGGETMSNQGDTDMSNLLRNVVPSYNVNDQPISDAATLVRPANLRGLAPDHTLMLVNGSAGIAHRSLLGWVTVFQTALKALTRRQSPERR